MGVTRNAFAGLGFAPEAPTVDFPIDRFLVGSDIEPVVAALDAFVDRLTRWRPRLDEVGVHTPPPIDLPENDPERLLDRLHRVFLANAWGDGLPLVPPTRARVDQVLRGAAGEPPETLVGAIGPRGGLATLEAVAVSLAMAGGRPEHLPVLRAALEAVLDPALEHDKFQATSGSTFPVVVVNGPVAEAIRLNHGFGLLGPDPRHPAGATIGRALRLLLQNVGGALPGVGTMAIFGAMRYTNAVFAEDEAGLPEGWRTVADEHAGHPPGTNAVTVYPATGAVNVMRRGVGKESAAEEAEQGLHRIAGYLRVPNAHYPRSWANGTPGLLMLPPVVARQLAAQGHATKQAVREHLWRRTAIPAAEVTASGMRQWIEADADPDTRASAPLDPWPICRSPDQIMIAVAGGDHPTHAFWLQSWGPRVASRAVRLPEGFGRLVEEADAELGGRGGGCVIA